MGKVEADATQGRRSHRPRAVEPSLHRAGRRQELLLVGDERDLPPRDRGLELAAQDGHEQASGELPGVAHGVRLRAVRDQGVAAVDHALREVGVVVEGQHDRGIGADGLAHELLQATLGVRLVIGRGGAVQGEVNRVEPARGPYARDDALLEPGAGAGVSGPCAPAVAWMTGQGSHSKPAAWSSCRKPPIS